MSRQNKYIEESFLEGHALYLFLSGVNTNRNKEIYKKYNGLFGNGKRSLKALAIEHGVSKSRIQQICRCANTRIDKLLSAGIYE